MRLFFDLGQQKFITKPGYAGLLKSIEHKRGDGEKIEVMFYRSGVPALIGTPTEMIYAVKKDFEELTPPLILANTADWAFLDGVWSAELSSNGAEILSELAGAESKVFKAEFTFTDENGGPTSSQTLKATVFNDVWKGTEGTPLTLPTPEEWLNLRTIRKDAPQVNTSAELQQFFENVGTLSYANLAAAITAQGYQYIYFDIALGRLNKTDYPLPEHANLAAANAAEGEIGIPYFDTGAGKQRTTTDIA